MAGAKKTDGEKVEAMTAAVESNLPAAQTPVTVEQPKEVPTAKIEEAPKLVVEEVEEETKKPEVAVEAAAVQPEFEGAKNGGGNGWLVVVTVILVAGAAVAGGVIWWQKSGSGQAQVAQPTPAAEEVLPSPTPSEMLEFDKFPVAVLNGSGIKGEGNKVKETLEAAGLVVASVGNADNYDYELTEISVGKDVSAGFVEKLAEALGKEYALGPNGTMDEAMGIQVIVGSKKAE